MPQCERIERRHTMAHMSLQAISWPGSNKNIYIPINRNFEKNLLSDAKTDMNQHDVKHCYAAFALKLK